MQIRKSRWSKVYESSEEELVALLERKQIQAERHTVESGEAVPGKQNAADTQLWCAEGQFVCTVQDKAYSLQPGDVLDVPANTPCDIRASLGGCAYYESAVVRTAFSS